MQELQIFNQDSENPTVSARELHEKLNIKTAFKDWFPRMCEYGFVEGEDFCSKMSESTGGRPSRDAEISLDMAKQICMIQRTPEGKAIRQYLIDLEKAWNTPELVMARGLRASQKLLESMKAENRMLLSEIEGKTKVIEELQPKASYYDLILQCSDLISATEIAKDYGMSAKRFNNLLHSFGVQFKQGDRWFLYSKYEGNGYAQSKTHNYADCDGRQHAKSHMYWTQKGRLFLYELLKSNGYVPMIEEIV